MEKNVTVKRGKNPEKKKGLSNYKWSIYKKKRVQSTVDQSIEEVLGGIHHNVLDHVTVDVVEDHDRAGQKKW